MWSSHVNPDSVKDGHTQVVVDCRVNVVDTDGVDPQLLHDGGICAPRNQHNPANRASTGTNHEGRYRHHSTDQPPNPNYNHWLHHESILIHKQRTDSRRDCTSGWLVCQSHHHEAVLGDRVDKIAPLDYERLDSHSEARREHDERGLR